MMKVYGGVFDGRNRLIVAAKSKRAAHRAIEAASLWPVSYYSFSEFASETWNTEELQVASSAPGVVFSKPATAWGGGYVALHQRTDTAQKQQAPTDAIVNEKWT